jgi:hypothetical protein
MGISPGTYKAKGIKGSAQLGESEKGTLQVAVDLDVKGADGSSLGQMTTFMYFSTDAAPYSYERLRALGWKGEGPDDIGKLDDIDTNEVDVRVTAPVPYKATDGSMKEGASKIEILTGGGKVVLNKPLDAGTFAARLKALGVGGPSAAPSGGGAKETKPPF